MKDPASENEEPKEQPEVDFGLHRHMYVYPHTQWPCSHTWTYTNNFEIFWVTTINMAEFCSMSIPLDGTHKMEYKLWKFLDLKVINFLVWKVLCIESTCFYRGPLFSSQHPHQVSTSQPPVTPGPENSDTLLNTEAPIYVCYPSIHSGTQTHTIKKWFLSDSLLQITFDAKYVL